MEGPIIEYPHIIKISGAPQFQHQAEYPQIKVVIKYVRVIRSCYLQVVTKKETKAKMK